MKIRQLGAELFQADRQTDRHRNTHDGANSRFSQFCERAKKLPVAVTYTIEINQLMSVGNRQTLW